MDKKAKISPPLTNEALTKKFKSNFELVNYAIKVAENRIRSGKEFRSDSEFNNRAMQILEEIIADQNSLDKNLESKESDSEEVSSASPFVFDEDLKSTLIYEGEKREEGRYPTAEVREEE